MQFEADVDAPYSYDTGTMTTNTFFLLFSYHPISGLLDNETLHYLLSDLFLIELAHDGENIR